MLLIFNFVIQESNPKRIVQVLNLKIILSLLLFLQSFSSFSQQWLGISSSNYAGTYGIYSNPANIADSRYKFFMNISGANAEFINNYASWAAPFSFFGLSTNTVPDKYKAANGLTAFKNSYILEARTKPNSVAFAAADIRGPSMFYTFEKAKFTLGLTSRIRVLTNLSNTTSDVAHIIVNGTIVPDLYGISQKNNHFALNMNGYSEMGFTFGVILRESDQDFFKVGVTVKRVNGLLNLHALSDDFDFTISRNALNIKKQDVNFKTLSGTFGLTNNEALSSANFSPDWLFGNLAAGTGYGFDIGAVYEFRPDFDKYDMKIKGKWQTDGTKNKYLYRISAALLDIGSLNFNNPKYVNQTKISGGNIMILPGTFNKIESPNRLYSQVNNAFDLTDNDYNHSFVSPLPMAFSANFDYKFSEKIYLNATWIQSLRNPKSLGMNQPSMLAIIPRYESKFMEVALPIALQNGYRNFTVGLSGRIGPFFIGSDNLAGILNIGNPKGISGYFGLFLPIFRKLPDTPNACYNEVKPTLRQELKSIFNKKKNKTRSNFR